MNPRHKATVQHEHTFSTDLMPRRDFFKVGIIGAGTMSMGVGFSPIAARARHSERPSGPLDPASEARKIAFDRLGNGEKVLLISGFPQTRRSWNRLIPLLSAKFQTIPADLPGFGDSGFLSVPATTENVARVFHEFVLSAGPPSIIERLDKGEAIDLDSYYFRMSPIFETSAPQYDWINRIIAVGVGQRLADGPLYSIFEIL